MSKVAMLVFFFLLLVSLQSMACSFDQFVVTATPTVVPRSTLVVTLPPPTLTPIPTGITLDR